MSALARSASLHRGTLWRAAAIQGLSVAVLAVAVVSIAPHHFFVDWGWLVGPGVWGLCALLTARVLDLPALTVLAGAAVSGLPSALAVLAGGHWLGTALALGVFAVWCAALAPGRARAQA